MNVLCQHVEAITREIASRIAASVTERSAAYYVESCLGRYGLPSQRQKFYTLERFSKRLTPQLALSAAIIGTGLAANRFFRGVAGGLGLLAAWHYGRIVRGQPAVWEEPLKDYESRNVICRIAPRGEIKNKVVLVAHLDTGFSRLSFHPALLPLTAHFLGVAGISTAAGSLLTLLGGENEGSKTARMYIAGGLMVSSLLAALDEFSLPVTGANDNASGLAVALGVAEKLSQQPLAHTEVWLAFTGSEAAGGAGIAAFLEEYSTHLGEARGIVLKAVGVGDICWISQHRLGILGVEAPHPAAAAWAEKAASQHPELGVMGREIASVDEAAMLQAYGIPALTVTGCDRLTGQIPHLYQPSDTLDKIQGETLLKAAEFTWALLQTADQTPGDDAS